MTATRVDALPTMDAYGAPTLAMRALHVTSVSTHRGMRNASRRKIYAWWSLSTRWSARKPAVSWSGGLYKALLFLRHLSFVSF